MGAFEIGVILDSLNMPAFSHSFRLRSLWAPGQAVVTIPKSAILSVKNRSCLLSEFLSENVIYGAEAQLGLALCLYGEMCVQCFFAIWLLRMAFIADVSRSRAVVFSWMSTSQCHVAPIGYALPFDGDIAYEGRSHLGRVISNPCLHVWTSRFSGATTGIVTSVMPSIGLRELCY